MWLQFCDQSPVASLSRDTQLLPGHLGISYPQLCDVCPLTPRPHRSMGLVSVQYEFEYTAKNGRLVSIKPNESYILVSKTNQHWWHVRRDPTSSPFFVPAQYVVECVTPDMTPCKATPVIRVSTHNASRETYRFSTFGFSDILPEVKTPHAGLSGSFAPTPDNLQKQVSAGSFSSTSAPLQTDGLQLLPEPPPLPKAEEEPPEPPELPEPPEPPESPEPPEPPEPPSPRVADRDEKWFEDNEDVSFPSPPPSNIYNTIPELYPELFPELEPELDSLSDPLASSDLSASEQQSLSPTAPEAPLTEQSPETKLQKTICNTENSL
ncbi:unnamed protein product [Pleuronectes platessa]|uniref:SH3 domain-containing protein n=1 Tax=Pleuronectes platessa TaxID=8262 RepID=A0A9N7UW52_PLEPL|nr:unnamed protein product [Pleuronectes platessa]